jgi:hypothetical protein
MNLYFRDQAIILQDIMNRARNTGNARWSDTEIYRAINDAISTWHGRVSIPQIYTFPNGFTSGENEYALPNYIDYKTIVPQMKRTVPFQWWGAVAVDDSLTWTDVPGWMVEPNGEGGYLLRFDIPPFSTEGRLLWWSTNQPLPTTIPTISADVSTTDIVINIGYAVDCADYGYVKIDREWIWYTGATISDSSTVLSVGARGLNNGGSGSSHTSGADVCWGVAMPRLDLYRVLVDQCIIFLNELYLMDAASRETQIHQQMISFYQGRLDKFWRAWVPQRKARMVLDRRFISVE